jgi:DNA-binding Xre family transcriptional regulator
MAGLDYEWRLRLRMAERGMFAVGDLEQALAERGVRLSHSQVWRLVTGRPERMSLHTLVALCDILACGPGDLVVPVEARPARKRRARGRAVDADITPRPARVRRPDRRRGR